MDRDSVQRLRFDRRLQRRAGWLEADERQAQLDALPDVSDKMTTIAEEENAASAKPATPAPAAGGLAGPRSIGSTDEAGGSTSTY
jgi:hypothetical protein